MAIEVQILTQESNTIWYTKTILKNPACGSHKNEGIITKLKMSLFKTEHQWSR